MTSASFSADDLGLQGDPSKRALHFIWLIDVSFSMSGWKVQTVNDAIKNALRPIEEATRGQAKVVMRVIRFGSDASWLVGPEPVALDRFTWKDLVADGGATATARAINLLRDELTIDKLGRRNLPPVAILMSDGHCTDSTADYEAAISALNDVPWGKKAARLSIGIGDDYDKAALDKFISPYLQRESGLETLDARNAEQLTRYIQTVSVSLSRSASQGTTDAEKSGNAPVIVDKSELEETPLDIENEPW
ncbi:MAG: VWA domain-containing protein [Opitutales bacterium]|nr:VWA domain-containing protein [Opitutales bacterium]